MNLSKHLLFLPLLAATAMTSCVDAGYPGGPAYSSVGVSYGTYNSLPRNYVGDAYYSGGRHMLLRDVESPAAMGDILSWLNTPDAPLPSGADATAARWLAEAG